MTIEYNKNLSTPCIWLLSWFCSDRKKERVFVILRLLVKLALLVPRYQVVNTGAQHHTNCDSIILYTVSRRENIEFSLVDMDPMPSNQ